MTYSEHIHRCGNINEIIEACQEAVPDKYKVTPWKHPELNHGTSPLSSDEALNCYMSAYGEMHVIKCRAAMMNFPFAKLQGSIEIVDWGCGQGIGSSTVVEMLKQRGLLRYLRRVTLIEPSEKALSRAVANIVQLSQNSVEIDDIQEYLPSEGKEEKSTLTSIGYRYSNVVHVFSNILDVPAIDLGRVARMIASSHGVHYVLCIGPKNSSAYRMERFCSVFGEQDYFSKIDNTCYGKTSRTGHIFTCMTRCFAYNGASIDLSRLSSIPESPDEVYDEYDLKLQNQNKVLPPQKGRVYFRLQNILSGDDILYEGACVNETFVDFIVVRPNRGLVLVNVFDKDLDECKLTDQKIIYKGDTYQSPIELIKQGLNNIRNGIEELLWSTIENRNNIALIKQVVIFAENTKGCAESFFKDVKKENVIIYGKEFIHDRNISVNFYCDISLVSYNNVFDDVVKRKLAKMLSPSWHSYQEGRVGFNPVGAQKKLSESRIIQQKISGVAGSGKTQVLALRAVNAMKRTGGDVLVLTFNITLSNYLRMRLSEIREDFFWGKIDIYPYHQFFRIRAAECNLRVEYESYDDVNFFSKEMNFKKYSAIFIDEVQDYTTEWLNIVKNNFLLEENGEFVVFGDPKQNLYGRPIDKNGDIRLGVIGGQWNKQLTTSRRFTNPVLANLAMNFQAQFMPADVTDRIVVEQNINYQTFNYVNFETEWDFDLLVDNIIKIINDSNKDAKDFVVLASSTDLLRKIDYIYRKKTKEDTKTTFISSERLEKMKAVSPYDRNYNMDYKAMERVKKRQFTTDEPCLKISTIQSFKGWESPSVIFILEKTFCLGPSRYSSQWPQGVYTAITRARENIYIINIGNEYYHDFFRRQLL